MNELVSLKNSKFPKGCPKVEFFTKLGYCELVLYLFTKCNLKCSFCFQEHDKDIDMEYINGLPDRAMKALERDLTMQESAEKLFIRFLGGELFSDNIPDSYFDIYADLANTLRQRIKERYPNIKIEFIVTTNGAYSKVDRLVKFLKDNNFGNTVAISVDFVGRYTNDKVKFRVYDTIKELHNNGFSVDIGIVMTKRNINYMLNNLNEIKSLVEDYKVSNILLNSYIPNEGWEEDLPSDDDIWKLYKFCIVNKLFYVGIINYLMNAAITGKNNYKVCECKFIPTIIGDVSTIDCTRTASSLDRHLFFGDYVDELDEDNVSDVKASLGIVKRGCLSCDHYKYCPQMCWCLVDFKYYETNLCPLWCAFALIKASPEIQESYLKWKELKNV